MKTISAIIFLLLSVSTLAQSKVYKADIEGDIDLGLAPYVKRTVEEAEANAADAIIFRINTFGGRVDAATQIKDAIINSSVLTIAFIDKRAISAGSLIALSCDKIVMVPGASIGATTVVDQSGTKQSEKAQSYMRSEMRATAERTGRRTDIAEAMVDERVVIEGLVDSTQLVTLTSKEALSYGIADTILVSINDVMELYELESADIDQIDSNWAEELIRFLSHPIISSILIMVGLLGMFTEIKTPGWGLPGTAAVIALALFFGTNYILELASIIEIVIFIIGVVLLLVELFVIPGFGIFGILGIICVIGSLFMGLISDWPTVDSSMINSAVIQLAVTFIATAILFYFIAKFLPKTNIFNSLVLKSEILEKSGYTTEENVKEYIGKEGKALTDLRPSGTVDIEGNRVDVVTEGGFIKIGSKVVVIKEEGSKVVVRKK
ncbi:MAG: NfeD family protein [Ignavibacteria bacterium]